MQFFQDDFMLKNKTAISLFNEARQMPIFDFHCHLEPKEIYENKPFADITEAWLAHDHYKWRLMRAAGIDEAFMTGSASGLDKFTAYAKALELAPGNPLYHWSHMELSRYFGISDVLTVKSAADIYARANEKLALPDFKVRNFIEKSNVNIIFTTDDPADSLEYHALLKQDEGFKTKVLPAFRPDAALNIDLAGFAPYIERLAAACGSTINTFDDLKSALLSRIEFFDSMGCVASDHGIDYVPYIIKSDTELNQIFKKAMGQGGLTQDETDAHKTALLLFLSKEYCKRGWVMELHFGIQRNINSKTFKSLGANTGYDAMGDWLSASNLAKLLNDMEQGGMPKTITFTGNPVNNYAVMTIIGAFNTEAPITKMQFGTAWWFNDHINGMTAQIQALADCGLLGHFVGMLTDSRSFLSYTRHEYFRRILCNIMGQWIEDGMYNPDLEAATNIVKNISYNNAIKYFNQ